MPQRSYVIATRDLGLDAQPDWQQAAVLVGTPLAAQPIKCNPTPSTWSICGWHYIGSDGYAYVDSDGMCYAQGTVYTPPIGADLPSAHVSLDDHPRD